MSNPPVDVQQFGQSIWLDFIHRSALENGEMQKYIDEFGVIGVTSNPAIFQKAIGESDTYDTTIMHMLDLDAWRLKIFSTRSICAARVMTAPTNTMVMSVWKSRH